MAEAERNPKHDSDLAEEATPSSEQDFESKQDPAETQSEEPQNRRARRTAASQARKQRVKERREAEAIGLDAQEILDDALVRSTDSASKWLKRNSSLLQGVFVGGLLLWAGYGTYSWFQATSRAEATDALAVAVAAERGEIGDPAQQGQPNDQGVISPTPIYADREAKLVAAREAFESALKVRSGGGTAHYAKLALAGVLLDSGKFDEAAATFSELESSSFAASDLELKGRAIEGLAIVRESKADLAGALETYSKLEAAGIPGFTELAQYQRARLHLALKQPDQAKEIVTKLREKLGAALADPFAASAGFLSNGVQQLSQELGLEEQEAPAPTAITNEQLEALQRQLQESIKRSGEGSEAPASPEPTPAP